MPAAVHEDLVKVNLLGYIHGAQAALPYFKEQGYGILINNISVGGWFQVPYGAAYSASKFGLRGFSEALKGELNDQPRQIPHQDKHIVFVYNKEAISKVTDAASFYFPPPSFRRNPGVYQPTQFSYTPGFLLNDGGGSNYV